MTATLLLTYDVFLDGFFFFSSRRRHTRLQGDWSSDVCSSDLHGPARADAAPAPPPAQSPWACPQHHLGRRGRGLRGLGWLRLVQSRARAAHRSEERRVGEEGRSRWAPHHLKKKKINRREV